MDSSGRRISVEQLLALAQQGLQRGAPGRATRLLEPLLSVRPHDYRARLLMAQATLRSSPDACLHHLLNAEDRAKASSTYWILKARAEGRLNRPASATLSARRALVLSPARADALFDGFTPIGSGASAREAALWAGRSVVVAPSDVDAWLRAAQASVDARLPTKAFRCARRTMLLSPADAVGALWLIRTAIYVRNERAQALIRRCLPVVAPADGRVVALVAHSLDLAGDLAAATELVARYARRVREPTDLLVNLARYHARLGNERWSSNAIRQALIDVPGHELALSTARTRAEERQDYVGAYRWQKRYAVVSNEQWGRVRADDLKSLVVYQGLSPRIDPARRLHRLMAAGLLAERLGAYHPIELAEGWNLEAVAGKYHGKHEVDDEFGEFLWRLVAKASRPAPDRRIVDIGPGDGLISLRSAMSGARVTAIESSSLFAERVELFSRMHRVSDRVTVVRGTFGPEHLPLLRAADVVVCLGVLYHLADIGATIDVLTRSGRPLLLETRTTEDEWPDDARGRLHKDRLPVSWTWLVRALERSGCRVNEIAEWRDFLYRRTGTGYRRMLLATPR